MARERLPGAYDVVISCDNALPHLLTDENVAQAFRAMCSKLRPGGLLVITVRDYDKELVERPVAAAPRINTGPPRKVVAACTTGTGLIAACTQSIF